MSARLTPEATAHALALALPEEVVIPWCWRREAEWTDTSRYAWVDGGGDALFVASSRPPVHPAHAGGHLPGTAYAQRFVE